MDRASVKNSRITLEERSLLNPIQIQALRRCGIYIELNAEEIEAANREKARQLDLLAGIDLESPEVAR